MSQRKQYFTSSYLPYSHHIFILTSCKQFGVHDYLLPLPKYTLKTRLSLALWKVSAQSSTPCPMRELSRSSHLSFEDVPHLYSVTACTNNTFNCVKTMFMFLQYLRALQDFFSYSRCDGRLDRFLDLRCLESMLEKKGIRPVLAAAYITNHKPSWEPCSVYLHSVCHASKRATLMY